MRSPGLYPFTDEEIEKAPETRGVYQLNEHTTTIYIGAADCPGGIRGCLQEEKAGMKGSCTKKATSVAFEIDNNPHKRERELLQEHVQVFNRLPRCNYTASLEEWIPSQERVYKEEE
jgi:hypothetical protein